MKSDSTRRRVLRSTIALALLATIAIPPVTFAPAALEEVCRVTVPD